MLRSLWTVLTVAVAASERINLNAAWNFAPMSQSEESQIKATVVNLPHTAVPLSYHSWNPSTWEQHFRYTKNFDRPSSGARFFVEFGAVLTACAVTFNGVNLGTHLGGYLPFRYELTQYIKPIDNVLDVVVDGRYLLIPPNMQGNSTRTDFFQPAGIYRSVFLLAVPDLFLTNVFAKPLRVLEPAARSVFIEFSVDSAAQTSQATVAHAEIRSARGDVVSSSEQRITVSSGVNTFTMSISQNLSDIALWSPDSPSLYSLTISLESDMSTPVDSYSVRFGFRKAEFTKTGFYINGNRLQLVGLNRHQWYPYAGAAMPPRVQRRDVEILKGAVNFIRQSHYPQDESFLDACDELGLLVWIEPPGWGWFGQGEYKQLILQNLAEHIVRDRNHPSVVVYGARLNEVQDDAELWTQAQTIAKKLDDSRQTSGAMVYWMANHTTQQDVFTLNDYFSVTINGSTFSSLRPPRTDFPYFLGEAVGALSGPFHFYRRNDSVTMQQGQAIAHASVQSVAFSDNHYCGLTGWSGFDYPSANGWTSALTKTTGVFDLFRIPKLGAAPYFANVRPTGPLVIEPSFYWTLDDGSVFSVRSLANEGTNQPLIWSNADQLRLLVNGQSFAALTPSRTFPFAGLPCPPFVADFRNVPTGTTPDLRIEAYRDGELLGSRTFSSDLSLDKFDLRTDDFELEADGSDSTRLVMRTVDVFGNLRPRPLAEGEGFVRISLLQQPSDVAVLLGESPFPLGATGGATAVWLRSAQKGLTGTVTVQATHERLGAAPPITIKFV